MARCIQHKALLHKGALLAVHVKLLLHLQHSTSLPERVYANTADPCHTTLCRALMQTFVLLGSLSTLLSVTSLL